MGKMGDRVDRALGRMKELHEWALSAGDRPCELQRYEGVEGERVVLGCRRGGNRIQLMDFPVGRHGKVWPAGDARADGLGLDVFFIEYLADWELCFELMESAGKVFEGSLGDDVEGLFDVAWAER